MQALWSVNRWLMVVFGVMSGLYKVFGGEADLDLFGRLGLAPMVVAAFGGLQALSALALIPPATRTAAAIVLALCNGFATLALFNAGVQPFGVISIAFVVMAALAARTATSRPAP